MSTIDETSNKKPVQQHPTDATPIKDEIPEEKVGEKNGEILPVKNKLDVSKDEKKPEEPPTRNNFWPQESGNTSNYQLSGPST